MDWRSYIPHALVGGAIFGGILAAVLIPILSRRDMRRRHKEIELAISKLDAALPISGPGEPYVQHRKWSIVRRLWKGYYGSS